MKKILLGLAISAFTLNIQAQEAADKKIQAGLVAGFGINFQKMDTKLMATNGIGTDLTIGANINFSFNETIGFCTGVEFDFESLKFKEGISPVYYRYSDSEILTGEESSSQDNDLFRLTERKQKPIYLTVPTMILFRTNFIGYFRYFGKFGLRSSVLLSNKTFDTGFNYDLDINPVAENLVGLSQAGTNDNMTTSKSEMIFFQSAVGLAGGAEWNFSGSTSLVAEIGYYYGFMPLYWNKDKNDGVDDTIDSYLHTTDELGLTNKENYFSNQARQSQLQLKVSILF